MTVSLWEADYLEPFVRYLERQTDLRVQVRRVDAQQCLADLTEERSDVALLTSLDVLRRAAKTFLVPGIGLASHASFPPAKLYLSKDLAAIDSLAFDPREGEAAVLVRLIAKEHYGQTPVFVPVADPSVEEAWGSVRGAIVVGPPERHALAVKRFPLVLDLGREWFELTTRPMVWGLLATRHGTMSAAEYEALQAAASAVDEADVTDEEDGVPFIQSRLDEFSLQGLEEFANYLFLTASLDEVPNLRFTLLPGNEGSADSSNRACAV